MTAIDVETDTVREQAIADVERQLAMIIQRARARWRKLAVAIHPDLQPIGYKILATLVAAGPRSAVQLADELATDKSTLSRQVAQLMKLGLVQRRRDPHDRRVQLLEVTPQTADRVREVRRSSLADVRAELDRWELTEVTDLRDRLIRLTEGLVPRDG